MSIWRIVYGMCDGTGPYTFITGEHDGIYAAIGECETKHLGSASNINSVVRMPEEKVSTKACDNYDPGPRETRDCVRSNFCLNCGQAGGYHQRDPLKQRPVKLPTFVHWRFEKYNVPHSHAATLEQFIEYFEELRL